MPELYDDAFEIKMDEDILRERLELSLSRILDEPLSLKDGASRSYFEFEGSKIAGFIGRAMAGEIGDSPVKETSYQRDLASFEVCFSGGEAWIEKEHSRLPLSLRECLIDKNYSTYLCSPEAEPFTVTPFVL